MLNTTTQSLGGVSNESTRTALSPLLTALADRLSSQATASAGLVISTTTTRAKTGATPFYGIAQGTSVTIAAGVDMPVLTGFNISANAFNIIAFYIDRASVVTAAMGIEGTTLAKAVFPQTPQGKAMVGYLIITHSAAFTGGTTALSTATTVYVSPLGAIDATVLI